MHASKNREELMSVTYLILLGIGLLTTWTGLKTTDEVLRIAAAVSGVLFIIWGLALTPLQLQLLIAALAIVAVFPICIRCLKG